LVNSWKDRALLDLFGAPSALRRATSPVTLVRNAVNNAKPTSDRQSHSEVARAEEETLILDGRAELSPSQMVEQKLMNRLKASPLMMSQIQRRLKPGPR
ncbi:hypothetical protein R5W24_006547, partial [Gemmata sp. JC717]|uniref:hypothetical protein n=1 Tax=Gemmata algarum TaxID=2975278 RepID=UPI0021BB0212